MLTRGSKKYCRTSSCDCFRVFSAFLPHTRPDIQKKHVMEVKQEEKSHFCRLNEAKKLFQFPEHITLSLTTHSKRLMVLNTIKDNFLIVYAHRPMVCIMIEWRSIKVWKINNNKGENFVGKFQENWFKRINEIFRNWNF